MKIIDFTHVIRMDMPVYPGTQPPQFQEANTYEKDGFRETLLSLFSHTGTHMDAPAHLFADGITLDAMPVSHFVGTGVVIDCSMLQAGEQITMQQIAPYRALADCAEYLLFYTGWDAFWGTDAYFGEYPVISDEVADYLIGQNKKGIGLDVIGLDPIADAALPLHRKLLRHNIVIIENLTNLKAVQGGLFTFCALPMKVLDSDGAPVRAIGICQTES